MRLQTHLLRFRRCTLLALSHFKGIDQLRKLWHLKIKSRPTMRAPDVWDSAALSGFFLASSFSCSQAESTPAHTQVTQTVGRHKLYQLRKDINNAQNNFIIG